VFRVAYRPKQKYLDPRSILSSLLMYSTVKVFKYKY